MEIIVCSRTKAKQQCFSFLHKGKSVAIISICDIGEINPYFPSSTGVLPLQFNDVEFPQKGSITTQDAIRIANFVTLIKNSIDILIVHCEAGISRSSGVAAAILKAIKNDDSAIFDSPRYIPNITCYRKVLLAFNSMN